MEKLKDLIKKVLTKEVILYIVFGLLTTAVNLGLFFILNTLLKINENVSNFIAIITAVLFAYVTNKDLVFHSEAKGAREKWTEFAKFISGRAFTMIIEFVGGIILLQPEREIQNLIIKAMLTIIVIILNFFISKFFAFKKKK